MLALVRVTDQPDKLPQDFLEKNPSLAYYALGERQAKAGRITDALVSFDRSLKHAKYEHPWVFSARARIMQLRNMLATSTQPASVRP